MQRLATSPVRAAAGQLDLFHTMPGVVTARDAQDLMTWPFFSLAKTRRTQPIDFRMGSVWISVEAVPEYGMATIWDADILIWAASHLIEARNAGRTTSRFMFARPHDILTFTGRPTGKDHYDRLRAALDRLQSTTVATSIRQHHQRHRHRFSWINEWRETIDKTGRASGIELILSDWFYAGILDRSLTLTIDHAYFDLTGGFERWLYRVVRKHGGYQPGGWSFDLPHLYAKSGILSPFKSFKFAVHRIVRDQVLPGYSLTIERAFGHERLCFARQPVDLLTQAEQRLGLFKGRRSCHSAD